MCPESKSGLNLTIALKNQLLGVTLVELILSIVIISVAITGILTVMNLTIAHSVDPLLRHQAVAIAESYLEEILLQSYDDPDGIDGEASRNLFDDVDDYNRLPDNQVRDQAGNLINLLSDYSVTVAVSAPVTLTGSVLAKRITVTVSSAVGNVSLVGYRASY